MIYGRVDAAVVGSHRLYNHLIWRKKYKQEMPHFFHFSIVFCINLYLWIIFLVSYFSLIDFFHIPYLIFKYSFPFAYFLLLFLLFHIPMWCTVTNTICPDENPAILDENLYWQLVQNNPHFSMRHVGLVGCDDKRKNMLENPFFFEMFFFFDQNHTTIFLCRKTSHFLRKGKYK